MNAKLLAMINKMIKLINKLYDLADDVNMDLNWKTDNFFIDENGDVWVRERNCCEEDSIETGKDDVGTDTNDDGNTDGRLLDNTENRQENEEEK
jgi:hypothetical protein